MEFILIGIILIFVMTYRNSSGEGIYKFVKESATDSTLEINAFFTEYFFIKENLTSCCT